MRQVVIVFTLFCLLLTESWSSPFPGKVLRNELVRANESKTISLTPGEKIILTVEMPNGYQDVYYVSTSGGSGLSTSDTDGIMYGIAYTRLRKSPGAVMVEPCRMKPEYFQKRMDYLMPKLRETLREGDTDYAMEIARRLGEFEENIPHLQAFLESSQSDEVKKYISVALAQFPDELTKQFLKMLREKNGKMRRWAIEFFAALPDPRKGESTVLSLLKSTDTPEAIREAALEFALRHSGRGACRSALGRLVKSEKSSAVRLKIASVSEYRDVESKEKSLVSLLVERAKRDPEPSVRMAALKSLACLKGRMPTTAIAAMRDVLKKDGDSAIREQAGRNLLESDKRKSLSAILRMTKNAKELELRVLRCVALKESGDGDAAKELLEIYQDEKEPRLRAEALRSLVKIKPLSDMTANLTDALKPDQPDEVAFIGATYLGRYRHGHVPAVTGLTCALLSRKRSDKVRQAAAISLGHIGGEDAIEALEKVLRRAGREVRLAAVEALWVIGTKEALSALEQAKHKEKSPQVNRLLKKAIDNLKGIVENR